jgi:acyl-CoA reductase-like NAD-dependent aldehyde dehydrogenase
MIARKAAAALASGCTIVIKPSEDTPYSALALCQVIILLEFKFYKRNFSNFYNQLAEKAGFPAGCINVLTTSKKNTPLIGKGICEHPIIKKVSFTGSTPVGKIILANCASTVKKVQLELGGKYILSLIKLM